MDWPALLPQLLLAATILSGVTLIAAVVAVPWVLKRIPADYFARGKRRLPPGSRGLGGMLLAGVKNLLGAVLVLLGILMIFTPGQGLLTLLVGLMLMNFPGKYRLEAWLVARPGVYRTLNWLRRRQGLPDFVLPVKTGGESPRK